ncbi:uncharacterized protein LOC143240979 isoform X1 [Tachypleus tridentatus]|uniref:uncharacterized protein LOC143240979 isoform X1 n=1 Tax=Tachypleus tridentatus TaxID=6853 RepID=UPI003FD57A60
MMISSLLGLLFGVTSVTVWSQGDASSVVLCNTLIANQSMFCNCDKDGVDEAAWMSCFIINSLKPDDEVWKGFARQSKLTSLTITSQLSSGSLNFVPTEALLRTPQLEEISIKQCSIPELLSNSFVNLEHLGRLSLENDEIRYLHKHAISHLPRITSLVLSDNPIQELRAEALFDLPRLTFLVLDRNNISWIDDNFFFHLSNLTELELWNNRIQHITPYTFNGLKSLRRLDLYKNHLTKLDNYVFIGTPRLHELDLKENRISQIAPNAFHGLSSLMSLHLNRNHLRTLPAHVFRGIPNVMMLELSNNKLESIQRSVIEDLPRMINDHFIMYFRNNNLKCDCRLNWVKEYADLVKHHILKKELNHMKCKHNSDKITKRVLDLNFDNLGCLHTTTPVTTTFTQKANRLKIDLYEHIEGKEDSFPEPIRVITTPQGFENVSSAQPSRDRNSILEPAPSIVKDDNSAGRFSPRYYQLVSTSLVLIYHLMLLL